MASRVQRKPFGSGQYSNARPSASAERIRSASYCNPQRVGFDSLRSRTSLPFARNFSKVEASRLGANFQLERCANTSSFYYLAGRIAIWGTVETGTDHQRSPRPLWVDRNTVNT